MFGLFEAFAEMNGERVADWVLRFSGGGSLYAYPRRRWSECVPPPVAGAPAICPAVTPAIRPCARPAPPLLPARAGEEQSCPDPAAFRSEVASFFDRLNAETAAAPRSGATRRLTEQRRWQTCWSWCGHIRPPCLATSAPQVGAGRGGVRRGGAGRGARSGRSGEALVGGRPTCVHACAGRAATESMQAVLPSQQALRAGLSCPVLCCSGDDDGAGGLVQQTRPPPLDPARQALPCSAFASTSAAALRCCVSRSLCPPAAAVDCWNPAAAQPLRRPSRC
jgi:hypothetical protein